MNNSDHDKLIDYANILRAILEKMNGEMLIEITNESDEPFTIGYRFEEDEKNDKLFVRVLLLNGKQGELQ